MAGEARGRTEGEPASDDGTAARTEAWAPGTPVEELPTPAWLLADSDDDAEATAHARDDGQTADGAAAGGGDVSASDVPEGPPRVGEIDDPPPPHAATADTGRTRPRVAVPGPTDQVAGSVPRASEVVPGPGPGGATPPESPSAATDPPAPPSTPAPPLPRTPPVQPAAPVPPPWADDAVPAYPGDVSASGEPSSSTGMFTAAVASTPSDSPSADAPAVPPADGLPEPTGEPWRQFAPPPPKTGPVVVPPPLSASRASADPPAAPQAAAPPPAGSHTADPDTEPDPFPAAAYAPRSEPRLSVTAWRTVDDGGTSGQAAVTEGRFDGHGRDDSVRDGELRRSPLFRRLVAAAVVFAVFVVAFVVVALVNQGGDDKTPEPPATSPGSAAPAGPAVFPAAAPEGWSRTAAWTVRVDAPTAGAASIAATTEAVAVRTPDREIAVLDPATGRVRRTFALPPEEYHGVKVTRVDGTESVLAHVGDHLVYAPADGSAAPTTLDLPAAAAVVHGGDSPLVTTASAAFVVRDGHLAEVALPPGTTAMGADGADVIAVDPAGRWWNVRPGEAPAEVTPPPPRAGAVVVRMAAAGHHRVAVLWSGPNDATVTAVLHDAATGRAQITADAPRTEMRETAWVWGADGHVAALGALVFDIDARKAHVRSGFGPVIGWGNLLYGRNTDNPQTALAIDATDPTRPATPLGPGVPLPWGGPTGDLILILDTRPSTAPTLYALNREGSSSTEPSSPSAAPA